MSDPITITTDHLISAVMAVSAAMTILAGVTLKLLLIGINNKLESCHEKLTLRLGYIQEYGTETRELADEAHNRISAHVVDLHTK